MFQYNAEQWPKSWNAFDSLAEAYEKLGNVELAISNYKQSLVLDASNKNAVEHLQNLEQRSKNGKSPRSRCNGIA